MTDPYASTIKLGESMRLGNTRLIVFSLVSLGSMLHPVTTQANQIPRMGDSGIEPSRAIFSGTDVNLDRLAPVASAEAARAACPQLSRLLCPPIGRRSDGKTVEFDAPGATKVVSSACEGYCGTFAFSNNDAGTIVGYYTDKYVVPHGFIRDRNGRFLSFDAPGAGLGHGLNEGTVPYAIDAADTIVGQYEDANTIYHAFVRERNGSISSFDVPGAGTTPGAGQGTFAWNLNSRGDTAGVYVDGKGMEHGFVRSRDRHITTFDPRGSVSTFVCQETCLSNVGVVGGYYDKNSVRHGFLREPNGRITEFDAPGAGRAAGQGTTFQSVNAQGTIAGALRDSHFVYHAFLRYRNGTYLIGELPGAGTGQYQGTIAKSINAFDAVAGEVIFADNSIQAFERFANGSLFRFNPPDAAADTETSTNNVWGEIAGYYSDKNNLYHGFLWAPRIP